MLGDQDKIRDRAYEIWDRDGRQSGRDEEYWLQAERELGVAAGTADHTPLGGAGDEAATSTDQIAAPAPAKKKTNGAAKDLAAKAPAPRKRRGAQPLSQA